MQISNRGMTKASQIRGKKILSLERKLMDSQTLLFLLQSLVIGGKLSQCMCVRVCVCEGVCVCVRECV